VKVFIRLLLMSLFVTSIFNASNSVAAGEANSSNTGNIRDGAYFDIGLGYRYKSDPFLFDDDPNGSGLALFANGRYQKYGLFIELPRGTSKQQSYHLDITFLILRTGHMIFRLR
jgi:outer membrane protein